MDFKKVTNRNSRHNAHKDGYQRKQIDGFIIPSLGKENATIKLSQISQIINDYHNIINDLVLFTQGSHINIKNALHVSLQLLSQLP